MNTDSYEPLSEELYWRKKIGDEIREAITQMSVEHCEKENQLNSIIRAYQSCESIARKKESNAQL